MHRYIRAIRITFVVAALLSLLSACFSSGGDSPSSNSPPPPSSSNSTLLTWDAVVAPNLSGYRVYYGTAPGNYQQAFGQGVNVGNRTTHTISGLNSGTIYYFAVTTVNTSNVEGVYSAEVSKAIP